MLRIGCSEKILDVPLFAELYGYGPFAGRRNRGVNDPLYCRAAVFDDGRSKAVLVYSDLCSIAAEAAAEMRAELAEKFGLAPENIAFTATHTHTGPLLGTVNDGIGVGYPDPAFQNTWRSAVRECVGRALKDEEEIVRTEAGAAPVSHLIARNRAVKDGPVDPAIRWIRFFRADGSSKLLIHSHGIHGVSFNGQCDRLVSADWMGAANRLIREMKLADFPIFLQGASGDINPLVPDPAERGTPAAPVSIAKLYLDDLARGLENGTALGDTRISCRMETCALPVVTQTAEELRSDAAALVDVTKNMGEAHRNWAKNLAARLNEMAILAERGELKIPEGVFQTFSTGDASICFIPGELFIGPGIEILRRSTARFPMLSTCSNGHFGYFFSRECAERFPSITCYSDNTGYGFYEMYGYMAKLQFKFQNNIADFVIGRFIKGK